MAERERAVLTVSQVNEYVRMLLDHTPVLGSVYVRGEISNFTNHYKSGHLYFTLKDADGLLKTVMFRSSACRLRFVPENGMRVIVHGRISCYVRDGVYQLYADDMQPDGIGALYIAYEQLKARLAAEGLFDEARKKPLPAFPEKIGIITSPTGAAVRDMIHVAGRRFPMAELILYPALVQGEGAAAQLAEGIRCFNRDKPVDLIIIGRGGGSLEDLWAFNDEALARQIASSSVPVISAVGHETDFTICDFAADRRAPTPSAAAEIAVPDAGALRAALPAYAERMEAALKQKLARCRTTVLHYAQSRALTVPEAFLDDKRIRLMNNETAMLRGIERLLVQKRRELLGKASVLDAVSPLRVLGRGYAAVYDTDGTLVKNVGQVQEGSRLTLQVSDGKIFAVVENTVWQT